MQEFLRHVGAQRCNLLCVVGVTSELTMSQAHVLSVTHTTQQWSSSPVCVTVESDAFG